MQNNFDKCLHMLLEHEGGYVNNKHDKGGMTNLGVTKRVYDKWIDRESTEQEMRDLTPEDVAPIYKKNYWDRVKGDLLPSGLDWACFDWAVNSGSGRKGTKFEPYVNARPKPAAAAAAARTGRTTTRAVVDGDRRSASRETKIIGGDRGDGSDSDSS